MLKEIMEQVRENQNNKKYEQQAEIERKFETEPETVAQKESVIQMNVQTPKVMLGIKATNVQQSGKELLKRELATNYLFRNAIWKKFSTS